jgi:MFS family permease
MRSMASRNFRLFMIGQAVSQTGNWLTMTALSLLVLHLTDSGVALGVLTAFQYGPVLALTAWAGVVVDRVDKHRLVIIVQIIAMLQSVALAVLAFGHPKLWWLYVAAFVGGCTTAFDNPTRRALVVEMVPERDIGNASSLNTAMMTGSRIVGPPIAGVLINSVGFGWCFTVDAISYVAVLVGLLMMHPSQLRRSTPALRAPGQVREGIRYSRSVPDIWIPLTIMTIVGMLTFNFTVSIPLFVKRSLHGSDSDYTYLLAVLSTGSLIGALRGARRAAVSRRDIYAACAGFGLAMAAFASAPNLALAFPLAFGVGYGSTAFMTRTNTVMQVAARPDMRGRVLALQALVFVGSTPLGGPLVGTVSELVGARSGVYVGAAGALGAALWATIAGRPARETAKVVPELR